VPDPNRARPGRPHLARDSQQWIFDYVIQQTGLTYHWWGEERILPSEVRSHAMISKHLGRRALAREAEAAQLLADGERADALPAFYAAARDFLKAQHPVFELNDEKRFLYAGLQRCYEQVRALAAYAIERVEVEWEGVQVGGWLHRHPSLERAPLLFYVPGCDTTCEGAPNPAKVPEHARGWHVFSFDGPGLGRSTMRGIALTADNFERAASAVLDVLLARPEIDEDKVLLYGGGAGSFWACRIAAHDSRFVAAATKSTYSSMYYLMTEDSPRYKQLFAFLTRAESEEQLDETLREMTLDGYVEGIKCPLLMVTGEYDHRDPIDEVFRVFDQVRSPSELWLFADQFHRPHFAEGRGVYGPMLDWLAARLAGDALPAQHAVRYIEPTAAGPSGAGVTVKRRWYEEGTPG
jgi:dipeptidyl aminopeptidase/acylaminoacyl peptidase